VQVPEVDDVDAEAPEARLGGRPRAPGPRVDPDLLVVPVPDRVRARRDRRRCPTSLRPGLVAAPRDRPADEALVRAAAVGVGGVEEVAPASIAWRRVRTERSSSAWPYMPSMRAIAP